jgi:hypothetical protein
MIAALILFSIAATNLIWGIITAFATKEAEWLLCLILTVVLSMVGVITIFDTPTDSNVKKGEAYYVEQNHVEVLNGDTVNTYKTYEIIWNQNTK